MPDVATSTPSTASATTAAAKFDPKGKTFVQRLDAFIADAKDTHKVTIGKDSGRTAEWQHKHHVAHMFLFNKYNSVKPKNPEKDGKTIAWEHFQNADNWGSLAWGDYLRTKAGEAPMKKGSYQGTDMWETDKAPDQEKTKERVKQILVDGKIGNSGEAMVSAGYSPCKAPCEQRQPVKASQRQCGRSHRHGGAQDRTRKGQPSNHG